MATTDVERLIVSLEARTTAFEKAMVRANSVAQKNTKSIESRFSKMNSGVAGQLQSFSKGFVGAFAGAAALQAAQKLIDASTRITNSLKTTGLTGTALKGVYDKLFAAAQKNAAPIESLVDLYAKVSLVQNELGASSADLIKLTENVALALRAGGTDASAASGALLQLSQALGSGVVHAEEFNSILEGAPTIARAAAAGLDAAGGSVAKLRSLVIAGKVSSKEFFDAFQKGAPILEKMVAGSTLSIGQGFVQLSNALVDLAGRLNDATGVGSAFGQFLGSDLPKAIKDVGDIIDWLANSKLGKLGASLGKVSEKANELGRAIGAATGSNKIGPALGLGPSPTGALADMLAGMDKLAPTANEIGDLNDAFDEFRDSIKEVKPDAVAGFDELQRQLREGEIGALDAKKALDKLFGDDPMFSRIKERFAPLLDALAEVKLAAVAATGTDERPAMRQTRLSDQSYATFIQDRDAKAKETEAQKAIDTRTDVILKAAKAIGEAMTEAAARIQAQKEIASEAVTKATEASVGSATEIIKQFERFQPTAKYDVNHMRAGYGSDTVTISDGSVHEVVRGMSVTLADADRDLARRIKEFQTGIQKDIGPQRWAALNEQQQAALTSIAYNYGSLPDRIIKAIAGGSTTDIYNAIKGLGTDNKGINKGRRQQEADLFLTGASPGEKQGVESAESFDKRLEQQKQYIAGLQAETGIRATLNPLVNDYGKKLSTVEAAQQMLSDAQQEGTAAGKELSDVQQLLYGDLSGLSPAARVQAEAMRELANQTGVAEAAGTQLAESQARVAERLSESSALGKDVFGGLISDLRDGKTGAEALANALNKVADKLLDVGLNSLFDAGKSGSGGGLLGGLFSFLFAKKGGIYARGKKLPVFAGGGVSKSAAIFAEGGPEAAVPLPDGRRIPVDLRGPGGAAPSAETINVVLQDDSGRMADIADQQIRTRSGAIINVSTQRSVKAVRQQMPGLMANAQARSL
jgi:tape measure domain-containing protein